MNLPNKLTLLRILLIPVCLLLWALGQSYFSAAAAAPRAARTMKRTMRGGKNSIRRAKA